MNNFFALINRMKLINRWGLMRNVSTENIQEHSHQTAVFAHALCVIAVKKFGEKLSPEKAALIALYHDAPEIFTGDMPTPVKYFNEDIRSAYKIIEDTSAEKLFSMLPDYMSDSFSFITDGESELEWRYVKAGDTLSAYIKCIDEGKAGNREFAEAEASIKKKIEKLAAGMPALDLFIREFLPPFFLSLDSSGI